MKRLMCSTNEFSYRDVNVIVNTDRESGLRYTSSLFGVTFDSVSEVGIKSKIDLLLDLRDAGVPEWQCRIVITGEAESFGGVLRDEVKPYLRKLKISNSKVIDPGAFAGCHLLTEVKFTDDLLKTICSEAFSECTSLKSIELPAGLMTIGERAFARCRALETIKFPEAMQNLLDSHDQFYSCKALKDVYVSPNFKCNWNAAFIGANESATVHFGDKYERSLRWLQQRKH